MPHLVEDDSGSIPSALGTWLTALEAMAATDPNARGVVDGFYGQWPAARPAAAGEPFIARMNTFHRILPPLGPGELPADYLQRIRPGGVWNRIEQPDPDTLLIHTALGKVGRLKKQNNRWHAEVDDAEFAALQRQHPTIREVPPLPAPAPIPDPDTSCTLKQAAGTGMGAVTSELAKDIQSRLSDPNARDPKMQARVQEQTEKKYDLRSEQHGRIVGETDPATGHRQIHCFPPKGGRSRDAGMKVLADIMRAECKRHGWDTASVADLRICRTALVDDPTNAMTQEFMKVVLDPKAQDPLREVTFGSQTYFMDGQDVKSRPSGQAAASKPVALVAPQQPPVVITPMGQP